MKKKLMAALLGIAMVFTLTACSGDSAKTPEEIYDAAVAKAAKNDSIDADMKVGFDMDMGGMSIGMNMDMSVQMKKAGGDMQMALKMNTALLGQELNMAQYYKDGYYYIDDGMGTKVKTNMSAEMAAAQAQNANLSTGTSRDMMDKFEMTEEDGNYVFHYTIAEDKIQQYLDEALGAMADQLPVGADMNISNMSGVATVDKDGNIISDKVQMTMEMSMEGQKIVMDMNMDIEYKNVGQTVSVEYPADLDTYTEVSAEDLGVAA